MGIDFKVDLYCVCWNEMKILPFVIQYWKRFVRHAYVYDNGSDDGTIEYLQQFDWITVRHFDSEGINELAYLKVKNNEWKGSDADYVVVCDVDECLYSRDFNRIFSNMEKDGVTVAIPVWGEVCSVDFPEYDEDRLCHEICGGVHVKTDHDSHKAILFNPRRIQEINYGPGCHACRPVGSGHGRHYYVGEDLYLCHLKSIGLEYKIERHKTLNARVSDFNKKHGFATHYAFTPEKIRQEFDDLVNGTELVVP